MPESFWTLRGRCLKLGHDVPHANGIVPLRLITGRENDPAKITPYLFEQIAPRFAAECKPGDIVVAGRRFGSSPRARPIPRRSRRTCSNKSHRDTPPTASRAILS